MVRHAQDNPFSPGSDHVPRVWAGRVEQLSDFADRLAPRRLAGQGERGRTLLGEPGIGKSSLARRIAADAREQGHLTSRQLRIPRGVDPIPLLAEELLRLADDVGLAARREATLNDLLRRVDANASRLSQMVRSLLDTSAFEEGHIEVQPERIELAPLLGVLLHRLASVTAGHPVSVDVPEDTTVHADRALLEHVFENLLANTAKHTPQGTQVRVVARPLAGGVEVVVSDDGPGIPETDLPHVLDRFYRGGEPASRPPGGLGLGLALVRQILVAHGADLELTSEPGAGTRFAFVLPRTGPG